MRSTAPPERATVPERPAHAPAPGAQIPSHYRWCFGCGNEHPTGLHLRITAGDGLSVLGVVAVSEHHQGAPGLAHGGLLGAAFDEVLGTLNWLLGDPVVTARLETDFLRPVPVGSELHIHARVTGVLGRKVYTEAEGHLGSADGEIAVRATALFLQVPIEHFTSFGTPEYIAQAVADRANGGPAWRPRGQEVEVNL